MTPADFTHYMAMVFKVRNSPGKCLACELLTQTYEKPRFCDLHLVDWAAAEVEKEKLDVPQGNPLRQGNT